ncbi:MAG: ABC transporter permease [Candidatus Aminicenantales bacterium]
MTFWTIAANDLKLSYREKMFVFWLFVFPILFAVIFGLAFRESRPGQPKVALEVIDRDRSFLSAALVEALESETYAVSFREEASEIQVRGLVIPEGFSRNVLSGQNVELVLLKKPSSHPEASEAARSHVLKGLITILTRLIMTNPDGEQDLEMRYGEHPFERRILLKTETAGTLRAPPSGFRHSIPAATVMFILFTVFLYGGTTILEERTRGQLERTCLSPVTFTSLLSGKWISRLILGMFQSVILLAAGTLVFRVPLGNSWISLFLVLLLLCATAASMSILFGSIFRKVEMLIIFTILAVNTMAALGGCWWPIEIVPPAMRTVSYIFPTGWAMDALHSLISFGHGLKAVIPHILALGGYTGLFLFLAVRFFRVRRA